jgi:hypothetical protein
MTKMTNLPMTESQSSFREEKCFDETCFDMLDDGAHRVPHTFRKQIDSVDAARILVREAASSLRGDCQKICLQTYIQTVQDHF